MGRTDKRTLLPILMIAAGIILLLAIFTGLFLYPGGDNSDLVELPNQDIPYPDVARLDLAAAKRAFDSGQAVFVDVRDQGSFNEAHIPGAKSIPLSEISSRMTELDPQDWIILYCT